MPEPRTRPDETAEQTMRRLTRRGFLTGAVAGLAGFGAWRLLRMATPEDGLPWPLLRMLRFNEALAERLYSPDRLAPTFPAASRCGAARTHGPRRLCREGPAPSGPVR